MEREYKTYRLERHKNPIFKTLLICFALFYLVLLTSGFWFPQSRDDFEITEIGTVQENADRNRRVTLIRWDYSEEQGIMQLQLRMENTSLDGINQYSYLAMERSHGECQAEQIYEDGQIIVVNITDIPDNWTAVSLRIGMPDTDPEEEFLFRLYGSPENISTITEIPENNRNEYYIADTRYSIQALEQENRNLQEEAEGLRTEIRELNRQITEITEELPYIPAEEMEEKEAEISALETEIQNRTGQISDITDTQQTNEEGISLLEEKIQEYQGRDGENRNGNR